MSERFDCIVVGAGLSGITCAGYLGKAGKKVLVVDRLAEVGGSTVPAKVMGCTVSMIYPLVAKSKYGDANGWAKAAQDFGADVRMLSSSAPRIYLKGAERPFMTIPRCLSPEGAANWMVELLRAARPDLLGEDIERDMVPIMREIYEAPLQTLTVDWGEMSVKDWIIRRTDHKGIHFVFNMMMTGCIFTCDADYTWNHGSVGKGLVLLRMWLAGDGLMSVPLPDPQRGICMPLAEAIQKKYGCEFRLGQEVKKVIIEGGKAKGVAIIGKSGEVHEVIADDVVVSTRWGSYSSLFDPMPTFLADIVKQAAAPAHHLGSAFVIYVLDDSIKLDGAYFMAFDKQSGSHILGGTAQSTEQPWNAPDGRQFIWTFRIHTAEDFEKFGMDRLGAEMKTDMEALFPGFSNALVWESPVQTRLAPSHYFYNSQPKVRHSYPAVKHLYFAGDCTHPMHSMLTDGAASTGAITADEILGACQTHRD
jgi:phytoene dehydrogenase-like protein